MKVNLVDITKEMLETKELADVLNKNFKDINEWDSNRENQIFERLREINNTLSQKMENLEKKVNTMDEKLDLIIKALNKINPNLLLED